MKNYHKIGEALELTAPVGGVVSGTAYLIGSLLVVATSTAAAGATFSGLSCGACDLPKVGEEVWTENQKIYFDESEGKFTSAAAAGANPLVGVAEHPVAAAVLIESDGDPTDIVIAGNTITIADYAALAGKTVTVTAGGVAVTLTEADSGDWEAATSNDATAASLAAGIGAVDGFAAAAVGAVVTLTPGTGATSGSPFIGRVRLDGVAR